MGFTDDVCRVLDLPVEAGQDVMRRSEEVANDVASALTGTANNNGKSNSQDSSNKCNCAKCK
jgi:hypothetical protein